VEQRARRFTGGRSFSEQTMQVPDVSGDERKGEFERRELWLLLEEAILFLRFRSMIRGGLGMRVPVDLGGSPSSGRDIISGTGLVARFVSTVEKFSTAGAGAGINRIGGSPI